MDKPWKKIKKNQNKHQQQKKNHQPWRPVKATFKKMNAFVGFQQVLSQLYSLQCRILEVV